MASISSLISRFAIARQIPIFSKLSWLEMRRIARKSAIFEYHKGEIIRRQGDPPDNFYCLVSGRVQSYILTPEGKKDNVEFLTRGMLFGIISLLTGENHSLTYEAINDAVILQIPKDEFHAILKSTPQLGVELSHSLSQRLHRNVTQTKLGFHSVIISIYSPVKGSGSSTYAINLALSLQRETGRKVLFVSIYPKGTHAPLGHPGVSDASPQWKRPPVDFNEIVGDFEKLRQNIVSDNLKIDLLNVYFEVQDSTLTKGIAPFVSTLADDYDYAILDLPNEMDDVVLKTLSQSDLVELVVIDRAEDLKMARQVIRQLKGVLKENFKSENLQVIVSGLQDKNYFSFEEVNEALDYFVYTKLPNIDRTQLTVSLNAEALTVNISDPHSEYAQAITRLSRRIGGVLVGLVLGGGAALGIAHIGVIRVLEEENIPIDLVVGSSMGALLASFWAIGYTAKDLEKLAREFEKKKSLLTLVDPPLSPAGLVGGRAIRRWLRKHLGDKIFYDTVIPLKIIAYDLLRREELVIDSGSLVEAIRRSISIPGVIPPVQEDGRMIIDGGVLNPLPTNVLRNLGINKIIAVNVLQSPEQVSQGYDLERKRFQDEMRIPFLKSPLKYLGLRLAKLLIPNVADIIVRTLQASEYVISEKSVKAADILIQPDLTGISWFELYRVDDLIQAGEEAARSLLPRIKALVKS